MFEPHIQSVIDRVNAIRDSVDDHWQIPRNEALLLSQIARIGQCRSFCEIGTSYGFSTLHFAAIAREFGGHVHTFDISQRKVNAASQNLTDAGLIDVVTLHLGDARELVATIMPETPYDFVFVDAVKDQSLEYLQAVLPKTAPRSIIATDNTLSHASELAGFVEHLRQLPGAVSCDVPVGNGFELTLLMQD